VARKLPVGKIEEVALLGSESTSRMSLPWVRLDSGFAHNPKVLTLAEDKKWQAIACYVASLGYSGAQGSDGFLPKSCLVFIHGTTRIAADLVSVGLWNGCPGGWEINGWLEYQGSSEEHATRKARAKAAAEVRWEKERQKKAGA
jgi:hypothetical protein